MDNPLLPPSRITRLTLQGFRSLRQIDDLNIPPLAVLIGANGAGKSTLLRFLELVSWMLKSQKLQEFVLRHGGADDLFYMGARSTPAIQATLEAQILQCNCDYQFKLTPSVRDTVLIGRESWSYRHTTFPVESVRSVLGAASREAQLTEVTDARAVPLRQLLADITLYQFHDTSPNANLHRRWDVSDSARLRADGGNVAAVLLDLRLREPRRYQLIVRQIQRVLPGFGDFVLEPVAGKVDLRWQSRYSDKTFGAHLTSDGSLRLFCLLTLLNLPTDQLPSILCFDEPELGLHPHAMTLVAEMLKRVAQQRQVFIATQSPTLVDCFELENLIVADNQNGATTLRNLTRAQYQSWLDDDYLLSDLWLKDPIGVAP